jgi:hypothetical protein
LCHAALRSSRDDMHYRALVPVEVGPGGGRQRASSPAARLEQQTVTSLCSRKKNNPFLSRTQAGRQELLVSNMVTDEHSPAHGAVFDAQYDLAELCQMYLRRHHPRPSEVSERFKAKFAAMGALRGRMSWPTHLLSDLPGLPETASEPPSVVVPLVGSWATSAAITGSELPVVALAQVTHHWYPVPRTDQGGVHPAQLPSCRRRVGPRAFADEVGVPMGAPHVRGR